MTDFRKAYRQLTAAEQEHIEQIKDAAIVLDRLIAGAGFAHNNVPDFRCIALANTKLEECVMWAVKAYT